MFPFWLEKNLFAPNTNFDLKFFSTTPDTGPTSMIPIYALGGFIVFFWIIAVLRSTYRSYKLRQELKDYHKKKAEAKMAAMNVSDTASKGLEVLAASVGVEPDALLADNVLFEKAVAGLRATNPQSEVLSKLHLMRQELEFTFTNPKAKFISTEMLTPDQQLRAYIDTKGEPHCFITKVVKADENELWVRPPVAKNKVVDLSKFKQLRFRLYRNGDGEYQFTRPLKQQISSPTPALVFDHATQFEPLNHLPLQKVKTKFQIKFVFLVPQDSDDPFLTKYETKECQGTIAELSSNQLRIVSNSLPDEVIIGTYCLFKFKEAEIPEKIKGRVSRVDQDDKFFHVNINILEMSEKGRRQLEDFMHTHQRAAKEAKAPKAAKAPSATPQKAPTPDLEGGEPSQNLESEN